jgi:hypothetical protein
MADVSADVVAAPRSEKLSFWTKAAYAIGNLGNSAGPGMIVPFWYLYFLTDVARLDPALAGVSILVGNVWDGMQSTTRWSARFRTARAAGGAGGGPIFSLAPCPLA